MNRLSKDQSNKLDELLGIIQESVFLIRKNGQVTFEEKANVNEPTNLAIGNIVRDIVEMTGAEIKYTGNLLPSGSKGFYWTKIELLEKEHE